jgi:hypothetical protein
LILCGVSFAVIKTLCSVVLSKVISCKYFVPLFMTSTHSVFEVMFFFLVQLDCDIERPTIARGPLPKNIAGSRISEVPSGCDSPDRCAEHLSRIADLEGRLSSLKHQTRTAMEQAGRSSDLLKKVSSLEELMSILMAKIVPLYD